jgi:hypothetical protein
LPSRLVAARIGSESARRSDRQDALNARSGTPRAASAGPCAVSSIYRRNHGQRLAPSIRKPTLNFSGLSNTDVFNLALQRTETLLAVPIRGGISPSYLAWHKLGLDFPLALEVAMRREQIIRQCEANVRREAIGLINALDADRPLNIVDIGPGLGMHVVALAERLDIREILLIDIEETEARHHGFATEGAGYNALATSKQFIEMQGSGAKVETLNPVKVRIETLFDRSYDVILSLLSCGFHYPTETYLDFFIQCLEPQKGRLILDLRRGIDHGRLLQRFSTRDVIERGAKHDRVVLALG